jgi:hypothetical protein
MDVVVGAMLFFWTLSKDLLSNTLLHLEEKAAREGLNLGEILEQRWGWYQSFIRLSRELRIHLRDVGKEPLHESLTLLSYLIDEAQEEAKQIKKQMKS